VEIVELLNASTGLGYGLEALMLAGERIVNAQWLFLIKPGFSTKDDSLPPWITSEPLPDGRAKGDVCELDKMLPIYYRLRD